MTDEDQNVGSQNGTGTAETAEARTVQMSQADLDRLISERVERARRTWSAEQAKADESARRQAEIEKLEGTKRLEAQYKLDLEKVSSERDSAVKALRTANARAELSARGLDASFADILVASDEETTRANIESFQRMVDEQVAAKVRAGLHTGAPPAASEAAEGGQDPIKSAIYRGFGIKNRGT